MTKAELEKENEKLTQDKELFREMVASLKAKLAAIRAIMES